MSITLHDVAQAAGVSIKTVSNVINDYPHIRPATRLRVEEAVRELGYSPNLHARGLRSGRTGTISLVIPDLRNAYFAELAEAVMRQADARKLSVIIELSGADRSRELALTVGPRQKAVDGILFSPLALTSDDRELLTGCQIPLVLLGERIFDGSTDHVTMQNIEAAAAATNHLLDTGRRRILALGVHPRESMGSAALRLEGYRRALRKAGIRFDRKLTAEADGWHRSDGAQAMRSFLASGTAFDGVVAFNDSLALGAMSVIQAAGRRIPQDVAIIGFDDIDEARYSNPPLSSINPGRDRIAEMAVKYLAERLGPTPPTSPREYQAPFQVVPRTSTTQ